MTPKLGDGERTTTAELRELGLPEFDVHWIRAEERACGSDVGLYVINGGVSDRLVHVARRHPAMTLGLTTALWLGNVLPHRPPEDHWLIDEAKYRPIWLPPGVRVHRSRHASEDTFCVLKNGVRVHAHLPLRAALDCLRFREKLGSEVVREALRAVLERGKVELTVLLAYARLARVRKAALEVVAQL